MPPAAQCGVIGVFSSGFNSTQREGGCRETTSCQASGLLEESDWCGCRILPHIGFNTQRAAVEKLLPVKLMLGSKKVIGVPLAASASSDSNTPGAEKILPVKVSESDSGFNSTQRVGETVERLAPPPLFPVKLLPRER